MDLSLCSSQQRQPAVKMEKKEYTIEQELDTLPMDTNGDFQSNGHFLQEADASPPTWGYSFPSSPLFAHVDPSDRLSPDTLAHSPPQDGDGSVKREESHDTENGVDKVAELKTSCHDSKTASSRDTTVCSNSTKSSLNTSIHTHAKSINAQTKSPTLVTTSRPTVNSISTQSRMKHSISDHHKSPGKHRVLKGRIRSRDPNLDGVVMSLKEVHVGAEPEKALDMRNVG